MGISMEESSCPRSKNRFTVQHPMLQDAEQQIVGPPIFPVPISVGTDFKRDALAGAREGQSADSVDEALPSKVRLYCSHAAGK